MMKSFRRVVLVLAALGPLPFVAFADEIVHFTNGAEMTVRSHTVEKDKNTLRLDLGENNFIAFPMAMVDKIVSSGQNVYLNPGFHPSNQAIAGSSGGAMIADTAVHGTGAPVGLVRQPGVKGGVGAMMGEAADARPFGSNGGPQIDQPVASSRRRFNPTLPSAPGAPPQVILPQQMSHPVTQLVVVQTKPAESEPAPTNTGADNDPASGDPPNNR